MDQNKKQKQVDMTIFFPKIHRIVEIIIWAFQNFNSEKEKRNTREGEEEGGRERRKEGRKKKGRKEGRKKKRKDRI